nr:hypothetical protein [Pseudonocardia halophobica]
MERFRRTLADRNPFRRFTPASHNAGRPSPAFLHEYNTTGPHGPRRSATHHPLDHSVRAA